MDGHDPSSQSKDQIPAVCVTGSMGYIGSWLVESLLRRDYTVHATARNSGKKAARWGNLDRLRIFEADLTVEESFDDAIRGCVGVFHVAAPMLFDLPAHLRDDIDVENYVRSKVLDPAVRGTMNVLRSCKRSGTVKRVVFTSSISTITSKDDFGNRKPVVDESCTTPIQHVWNTKPTGWVYVLMKLVTEEAAFEFAKENGLDLVSVVSTTVGGPFLTPNVPSSLQVLLSPLTGNQHLYSILLAVNARLGTIGLVHIEDICEAHIFLMEKSEAKGRYICSAGNCDISSLTSLLASEHSLQDCKRLSTGESDDTNIPVIISSKRLTDLGFEFKKDVKDVIKQSVKCLH